MRLLVDSDVLLDVAAKREPWLRTSGGVLDLCELGAHSAFVSWHSLANLYYCTATQRKAGARRFIRALIRFAQVVQTGTEDMAYALDLPVPDLEDAMQAAAAVACRAHYVVTRNTRHFGKSPIPAITPAKFLAQAAK